MKRAIALVLSIVFIILCCSCQKKTEEENTENSQAQQNYTTVRVTFPEGKTVAQYADILEENGVCSAEDFISAVNNTDYSSEYGFLPEYSALEDRIYRLEGYLYPDTYEFYMDTDACGVVRKMLNNFSSKVSDAFNTAEGSDEFTLDEVVTLASIIERESYVESERPKIAQVFINRLHAKGNIAYLNYLQSNATMYYPYVYPNQPEGFVSEYDTFKVKGLPKGPICSPSLSSMAAVLSPDTSVTAYYFYTDKNGKHYYADSYEQHQKNIKYCKDNGLA